jgi:formate transporter
MEAFGVTADYLNTLTVGNFLFTNLLPVTLGNIIGGSLCIGTPLYYLNRKK